MAEPTVDTAAAGRVRRTFLSITFLDYFGDMCIAVTSVLLLQERGLSSGAIIWLIASVWVLEAVLEVPTGVFADAIGRRLSIVLSFALRGVGYSMLFFSASPSVAIAGTLLAATGAPFASGALEAWAVDRLRATGPVQLDPLFAVARIAENLGMVAGIMTGAVLGQLLDLSVPQIVAGSACLASGVICVVALREPRRADEPPPKPSTDVRGELWQSAREVVTGARLALTTDRLLTALLVLTAGLWMLRGLPGVQWTVHFNAATGSLVALGLARSAGDLIQIPLLGAMARVRSMSPAARARVVAAAASTAGAFLFGAALVDSGLTGIVLYTGFVVAWGLAMPGLKAAINERVPSGSRATILSVAGLANALATGVGLYVVGAAGVDLAEVSVTWPLVAVGTAAVGIAAALCCARPGAADRAAPLLPAPLVGDDPIRDAGEAMR